MPPQKIDKILLLILRLGCFFCFAGWTWVHFYWEGPYGVLFWQDSTFSLADWMGVSWDQFVGSGENDGLIQKWVSRIGWLYLICSVVSLTARKESRFQLGILIGGFGLLTVLSYAKYLGAQRQLPMFVEHGGQMLIPLLLVLALRFGVRHRATVAVAMVALITTFAGHGAYAFGWHWPTPANFYGMTSVILNIEHETVKTFLRIAGLLDFLICIGIFVPFLRLPSVAYAAVWGLLTALARPVAGMSTSLNYWGADQFLHETVLRAPHFAIPLFLFLLWRTEPASGPLQSAEVTLPADDLQTCGASHKADLLPDNAES